MNQTEMDALAEEFFTTTGMKAPGKGLLTLGDEENARAQAAWDAFLAARPKTERANPFTLLDNCRYGRFLVPLTDAYVGRAMAKYGEYSQLELELLLQFILPSTRVVIAGANLGTLVVPIAQRAGEVVAFEPQRWVFQLLCSNLALNGITNTRAYWGACGSRRGVTRVPVLSPDVENNFGALELPAVQDVAGGDIVPVHVIDEMPTMDCGLITIDVEGMELQVLKGAEKTIERCRPPIFFEADRAAKNPDVFAWLRARKYELHWYRTPLYNPKNHAGDAENIYEVNGAPVGAMNVIATPKERGIVLTGFPPVIE